MSTDIHDNTTTDTDIDPEEAAGAFAWRLAEATIGTLELATIALGDRLGFYAALRDGRPRTTGELAERTGINERFTREWLEQQAAAGILVVNNATADAHLRRFALPEPHAWVLCEPEHPAYSLPLTAMAEATGRLLDELAEGYRSGRGLPFAAYTFHDTQAALNRPLFANAAEAIVGAAPDVAARLTAGESAKVADVGCGEGWFAIYVAERYPSAMVWGFDRDEASIAAARGTAAERGVADRVKFELHDGTTAPATDGFDLVTGFEVVHDVADPVGLLASMRAMLAPGGAVIVGEPAGADEFSADADPVQRMLYAASVIHCLPVSVAAGGNGHSAAIGGVLRPATLRAHARAAGFAAIDDIAIDHPLLRFYRLEG